MNLFNLTQKEDFKDGVYEKYESEHYELSVERYENIDVVRVGAKNVEGVKLPEIHVSKSFATGIHKVAVQTTSIGAVSTDKLDSIIEGYTIAKATAIELEGFLKQLR